MNDRAKDDRANDEDIDVEGHSHLRGPEGIGTRREGEGIGTRREGEGITNRSRVAGDDDDVEGHSFGGLRGSSGRGE